MYDLIIIGAGPAGLTASIYASCYKLNHIVIGKVIGGQLNIAPDILNYPGFKEVKGTNLTQLMVEQTQQYGSQIITDEVIEIRKEEDHFKVTNRGGSGYEAKTIILATGAERRKLNVPGELEYTSRGVYYSVVLDPIYYKDKHVVIAGGGNAGFQAAAKVINDCLSVTILEASTITRAEKVWIDKTKDNPKLKILLGARVKEVKGDGKWLREIIVDTNGMQKTIETSMLFVEIGGVPGTALVAALGMQLTEKYFIQVDHNLQTSIPNIFAAGDIIGDELSLEQIATAVGLGARATASVYQFLRGNRAPIVWGKSEIRR